MDGLRKGSSYPPTKKKLFITIYIILLFSFTASSQQVIENSEKPLAKNPGRALQMKEVWRITDEGGQFYFKFPGDLKISSGGDIFIADKDELLKFSPDGKYIKNLFKKGQGPGEISGGFSYSIKDDNIYIYDFMAVKIVQIDLDGNLIAQTRIETGPYNGFSGVFKNWFVFQKEIFPPPSERKSGLQNLPCIIKFVSQDGKTEKDNNIFQREMFVQSSRFTTWTRWHTVLDDQNGTIYVSHTRDYLIEALGLDKGQVIMRFKRKYASVKYKERGWEKKFYRETNAPKIKYEADISGLYVDKNTLWVKTSTTTKEKGDMYDIFDAEGRFIDNFYLGASRTFLCANGEEIFVLEKDKDENFILVKYKITK